MKKLYLFFLTIALTIGTSGCATFYKVQDPVSGKTYYTEKIDQKSSGAIEFKDEVTKTQVTLPQSEVIEITEDQYRANIHTR